MSMHVGEAELAALETEREPLVVDAEEVQGGIWKAARAEAEVNASWDADTFIADASRGALLQWKEARFGGSVFGALIDRIGLLDGVERTHTSVVLSTRIQR